MSTNKRSFFERLTGSYNDNPESEEFARAPDGAAARRPSIGETFANEIEESNEEGQLTVDAYETPSEIIIQSIVAGIRLEDLDVSITQDMVTIRGKRLDTRRAEDHDFFYKELYWGNFGRTILLPQEIDPDEAEATLKNGLLTIRLEKLDKERVQKLKIKNE